MDDRLWGFFSGSSKKVFGKVAAFLQPTFYLPQAGETYASISKKIYGSDRYTRTLASANGYRRVEAGKIIYLPGKDENDGT